MSAVVCLTCGRTYSRRMFSGPGHRGICANPVESLEAIKTVSFDVVQESGEGNEIARERCTTTDDQDMIDNAISDVLEAWILSIGDIIRVVEIER